MLKFLIVIARLARLESGCAIAALCIALILFGRSADAASFIIVGESQYPIVADVMTDIQESVRTRGKQYATSEIRGRLAAVVEREGVQVVVALGMDALNEALRLPPEVAVVFGLVAVPPKSGRANITGVIMSTPVNDYVAALRKYLPEISSVAVVGSRDMAKVLYKGDSPGILLHQVTTSTDLVNTINHLTGTKALLLLPDASLLTASVMSHILLHSFKNNIPLLGISEANVKQGALFALVFDAKVISRQIGEKVHAVLDGVNASEIAVATPKRFNLYLNVNTARKMGIDLPDEMVRSARKTYN